MLMVRMPQRFWWPATGACCALFILAASVILPAMPVSALRLQQPSLAINDPTVDATTTHTFSFGYASTATPVGSVVFEYCTNPLEELTCDAPAGLDASGATLAQQTGATGFFVLTAQTNKIVLTRAVSLPPSSGTSKYVFNTITNPSGPFGPFYARITTYSSTDGSGARTDFGAVVNSTAQGVHISSEVPPLLKFCVGVTITGDCSTADGNIVDLGTLTTAHVSSGTSQMQAATNAPFGLAISVYGNTMTSGNNSIPALGTPTVSAPGNAQFGFNLRHNTNPAIGTDPSGSGVATPSSGYNTPDKYMFANGSTVATSPVATDVRTFTASYIANIPPNQTAGVYTATLTYICTATF